MKERTMYGTDAEATEIAKIMSDIDRHPTTDPNVHSDAAGQINARLQHLELALQDLDEVVHRLRSQLEPVLRPSEPRAAADDKAAMVSPPSSQVAALLDSYAAAVAGIRYRLTDIIDRLEV